MTTLIATMLLAAGSPVKTAVQHAVLDARMAEILVLEKQLQVETAQLFAEYDRLRASNKELLAWHKAELKRIAARKAAKKAEAERNRRIDD